MLTRRLSVLAFAVSLIVANSGSAFIEGTWTGKMKCTSLYNGGTQGPAKGTDVLTLIFGAGGVNRNALAQVGTLLSSHTNQTTSGMYVRNGMMQYSAAVDAAGDGVVGISDPGSADSVTGGGRLKVSASGSGSLKLTTTVIDFTGDSDFGSWQTCSGKLKRTDTAPRAFVFVTSGTYDANLSGWFGADHLCGEIAQGAGASFVDWHAWLSASNNSAAARLQHASYPFVMVNGTQIADSWDDLTDGTLDAAIDHDQFGQALVVQPPDVPYVWTGSATDGSALGPDFCSDWTVGTQFGQAIAGVANATDASWTLSTGASCNTSAHVYCIGY